MLPINKRRRKYEEVNDKMNTDKLGFMASLGFAVMAPEEALRILSKIGYKAVGWTLAHLDPREQSVEEIKQISGLTLLGANQLC